MLRNLRLRTKLIAIAVPPLLVLAFVAGHGLLISFRGESNVEELTADIRVLAIIALAAVLLSTLTLVLVWPSIVQPLQRVTTAANDLANKRLPRLVDSLTDPTIVLEEPTRDLDDERNDELGALARSLTEVSQATNEVAERQKDVVSASIRELVINLARRSQTLVDRQLEYISSLEQTETDAGRLDELFRLDHLATRMRRNAESLLVLAGAEPTDRRGRGVSMADIARVAVGEIERYRQVALRDLASAEMDTSRAVDLAHLLSELMENATQFSPPDVPAAVTGTNGLGGTYVFEVVDSGLGMTDEQLAIVNDVLADPPDLGLALTRSLGFLVVAKLAHRLETEVVLAHTPGGGVTATVTIPATMLIRPMTPAVGSAPGVAALGSAPEVTAATPPAPIDVDPVGLPQPAGSASPFVSLDLDSAPALEQRTDTAADVWSTPAPVEPAAHERPGRPITGPPMEQSPLRADELLADLDPGPAPTALTQRTRTEAPEPSTTDEETTGHFAPRSADGGARLLTRYHAGEPSAAEVARNSRTGSSFADWAEDTEPKASGVSEPKASGASEPGGFAMPMVEEAPPALRSEPLIDRGTILRADAAPQMPMPEADDRPHREPISRPTESSSIASTDALLRRLSGDDADEAWSVAPPVMPLAEAELDATRPEPDLPLRPSATTDTFDPAVDAWISRES